MVHDDNAQGVATALGVSQKEIGVCLDVAIEVIHGNDQPASMFRLASCQLDLIEGLLSRTLMHLRNCGMGAQGKEPGDEADPCVGWLDESLHHLPSHVRVLFPAKSPEAWFEEDVGE